MESQQKNHQIIAVIKAWLERDALLNNVILPFKKIRRLSTNKEITAVSDMPASSCCFKYLVKIQDIF